MWCDKCHYGSEAFQGVLTEKNGNTIRKCPNCKDGRVNLSRSPFPKFPTTMGKGAVKAKEGKGMINEVPERKPVLTREAFDQQVKENHEKLVKRQEVPA